MTTTNDDIDDDIIFLIVKLAILYHEPDIMTMKHSFLTLKLRLVVNFKGVGEVLSQFRFESFKKLEIIKKL